MEILDTFNPAIVRKNTSQAKILKESTGRNLCRDVWKGDKNDVENNGSAQPPVPAKSYNN